MEYREDTARILEIPKILRIFAKEVRGELGLSALDRLRPQTEMRFLEERIQLFRDFMLCRDKYGEWPWNFRVGPVDSLIDTASKSGLLSGEELVAVSSFLSLARGTREHLALYRDEFPLFDSLSRKIRDFSEEIDALGVLDDGGNLYDSATPTLSEIRRDIDSLKHRVRSSVQSLMESQSFVQMLQEKVAAFRNEHFVFLVKQEHINRFPGTVIDRSVSGNSVYMEPSVLVPLNNRIALRSRDEKDEEQRILRLLTAKVAKRARAIAEAQTVLEDLDLFYGAASIMSKQRWKMPELVQKTSFSLKMARHPLLGEGAVPVDIKCGDQFRSLVITGPNTGGKTVVLKTAGVCIYLAWCGLPIPVGEGSSVGIISSIYCDIGDEQSIEQNLSTFSAHVKNIITILESSDRSSLILLDELGAGTDPQEGAALGIAILDAFTRDKGLTLATTHHNPVKQYALTAPRVETASMEFDVVTLSPTYRILLGVPGKSNALLIAQRYGMPDRIIEKARSVLSERDIPLEDIIGELNEKKAWLDREEEELAAMRRALAREREQYKTKSDQLDAQRDAILAKAESTAAKILEQAEESSKSLIRRLDESAKSAVHKGIREEQNEVRTARKRLERRQEVRLLESGGRGEFTLDVGKTVQIVGTEIVGVIEELRGKKASVRAGAMKMEVDVRRLAPTEKKPKNHPSQAERRLSAPDMVPPSVMVRGMNVQEALPVVERYLDAAMRLGYSQVTVIHGRGEGILRREIHALCASLRYVESYRLGEASEGGFGVTIVTFKG